MKGQYEEKVKKIHAPEELINITLQRIHNEKQKKNTVVNKIVGFSLPAIIAASVFFATNFKPESELIYNKVPNMLFISQKMKMFDEGINKEKISVDKYAKYTKVDLYKLMDGCGLKNKKIQIDYFQNNSEIVDDEGLFTSVKGKKKITLRISKEKNYMPQEMSEISISKYCGKDVVIVTNEDENMIIAIGKGEKVFYHVKVSNMDKGEFEEMLKKIISFL